MKTKVFSLLAMLLVAGCASTQPVAPVPNTLTKAETGRRLETAVRRPEFHRLA